MSALAGGALPCLAVLRFVGTTHLKVALHLPLTLALPLSLAFALTRALTPPKAACEARAIILNCKLEQRTATT